jgi:hypothetical protein
MAMMTEQEKQICLFKLLGWRVLPQDDHRWKLVSPEGDEGWHYPDNECPWDDVPNYFSDLNAAHALGEEMRRRGLLVEYLEYLFNASLKDQTPQTVEPGWDEWLLLCPASVRAEAALSVLEKGDV